MGDIPATKFNISGETPLSGGKTPERFKKATTKLKTLISFRNQNSIKSEDIPSNQFFLLSSYDFRLNPVYKEHFVGEVKESYIKKYFDNEDVEDVKAKNVTKLGFFSLLNLSKPKDEKD